MKLHALPRTALLATLIATALLVAACGGGGGGGGNGMMPPGDDIEFVPTDATPPANSISMQAGTVTGDLFQVRIVATGITDLFGAAFNVTYNQNLVEFVSASSSGSVLIETGVDTEFQAGEVSTDEVTVVATRLQNQAGDVDGVNVTGSQTLITLTFRALAATTGTPLAFADPREVCDSDTPTCTPINVTYIGGTLVSS